MIEKFKNQLTNFCIENKIDLLVLFGSYARGTQKKTSDIDFAYYSKKKQNDFKLLEELYDLFGNKVEIDLINLEKVDLKPYIKYRIFTEGKAIFEFQIYLFQMFKERAYFEYVDSKRFELVKENILRESII